MLIAISGTPGTGKTSIAKKLSEKLKYELIDINAFSLEYQGIIDGYDEKRKVPIINEKKLRHEISKLEGNFVIEGHLSHFCMADLVIILRTSPEELRKRLKAKTWPKEKIEENIEAEMIDLITQEAVKVNDNVFEVDTTGKSVFESLEIIHELIEEKNREKHKAGSVKWI